MESDRKKNATELRLKGASYQKIQETVRVSKSTLSEWFSKLEWSTEIKKELTQKNRVDSKQRMTKLNRVRGIGLQFKYAEARDSAVKEFTKRMRSPLFLAGLCVYWGEGDRISKGFVRVSNTDAAMLRLFVKFLVNHCGIPQERIKAAVLTYPDLDPQSCKTYWMRNLGFSEDKFTKTVIIQGKSKRRRLSNGVCLVVVSNSYLKVKLNTWLEMVQEIFNADMV